MSQVDPRTTLASLVNLRPELAAVLDRIGLDYCCGGGRRLDEAASSAELDLDQVIALLDQASPSSPAEWTGLEPAALVDHIEATHHAYLDQALPRLDTLSSKVAGVHGDRHPELAELCTLVSALRRELEPHLRREEQVLFPMIRDLATDSALPGRRLADPITVMTVEHDRTGGLLAALRALTDDYRVPDDGCASYQALYDGLAELESDTHLHVHKENNVLFPAILEVP